MKFSDLELNFDLVCDHSDTGIEVLKELNEFFKTRAQIEEEYAKKLQQLVTAGATVSLSKKLLLLKKTDKSLSPSTFEIGCAKAGWDAMELFTSRIADHHFELASDLKSKLCESINTFIKEKDSKRKDSIANGVQSGKNRTDAIIEYNKLWHQNKKIVDEKQDIDESLKKSNDQKSIQKLQSRMKSIQDKINNNSEKLSTALNKAKEADHSYFSDVLPNTLKSIELLETQRIQFLQTTLQSYVSFDNNMANACLKSDSPELLSVVDAMDATDYIQTLTEVLSNTPPETEVLKMPDDNGVASTEESTSMTSMLSATSLIRGSRGDTGDSTRSEPESEAETSATSSLPSDEADKAGLMAKSKGYFSRKGKGWGSMFGKRHQEEESDVPASTKSAGALPSLQKKKVESTPVSPTNVVDSLENPKLSASTSDIPEPSKEISEKPLSQPLPSVKDEKTQAKRDSWAAKMRAKIRLQSETSNLDENNDESTKDEDDMEQTNTNNNNDDDIIEDELEDIPL